MRFLATTARRFALAKQGDLLAPERKNMMDEAERLGSNKFTRATLEDSESKQTKSSIADHVTNENHLINWE